jgi:cation transport regulator ChaB
MPIAMLKELPEEARKLWEQVFESAKAKGKGDAEAAQLAWSAVQKVYSKSKSWQKKEGNMSKDIIKSDTGDNVVYYLNGILSLPGQDSSDMFNNVSETLLHKFIQPNFIEDYGTIEHSEYEKDLKIPLSKNIIKGKEPYHLDSSKVVGNELHIKFKINPKYEDYEKLIEFTKQGNYLNLSAEFKDAITYGNTIIDAQRLGWTVTNSPAQKKAKVYNIEKKIV